MYTQTTERIKNYGLYYFNGICVFIDAGKPIKRRKLLMLFFFWFLQFGGFLFFFGQFMV